MVQLRVDEEAAGKIALARASEVCHRAGVAADAVQTGGRPAETILAVAEARGAQIVAIGRPGSAGGLALGRVSDSVLRHARGAVLIAGEQVWARSARTAPAETRHHREAAQALLSAAATNAPTMT